MRYRHAIALETGQQQQNIFLVRALLDLETDILWQLHWLLLPKHVVLGLTSPYSGLSSQGTGVASSLGGRRQPGVGARGPIPWSARDRGREQRASYFLAQN